MRKEVRFFLAVTAGLVILGPSAVALGALLNQLLP